MRWPRKMIGPMSLVWTLGVAIGSVAFMAGALNAGSSIARRTGSSAAMALFIPVSVLLGLVGWLLVLAGAWRLRRNCLRRVGAAVDGTVIASDLRCKHAQGLLDFDLWQVRVEVQFSHPESAEESRVQKRYLFPQFREKRARALAERLHVGSSVPLMVHRNSALLDIPKRPVWVDIW
ncbi:hypothetical protein [Nocardia shimofusensis]|uniref:hypothetical protein n=1 Tax=Nocardia shimofusensis TaxID=228596 RepID=UPI00082E3428|nr:hypothetical protein [Nocardia shimofusensis]